jgi:hypothetical protein
LSGEPKIIYHAANPQQAHLLKGLLEARGIAAWVVNDRMQGAVGDALVWNNAPCVVVGENDAIEGQEIADKFDERTAHDPTPDEGDDGKEPKSAEWEDWPTCPECHERRAIRCPICGVSGTQFELADIQETEAGPRVLLMCDACDDHFRPEMFRLCHHCGHDYGDGYEIESATPRPEEVNRRVWLLAAGLIIGTALLIGYLALL